MAQQYVSVGYVSDGYYQTGLSIDWKTKVIFVPQFYLTYVSGTTYQLDTNKFRNDLKDIEDNTDGIAYPDTHRHNTQVVLSGITYARVIEIINGYTITFEDGRYSVNLIGSNNNIPDVLNLNQVSVRAANSAGLQIVNTGGGVGTVTEVANAVWNASVTAYNNTGTTGNKLNSAGNSGDPWATDLTTYNTAGTAGNLLKVVPTAVQNRQEMDMNSTKLSSISTEQTTLLNAIGDVSVSSSMIHTPAISFELLSGTVTSGSITSTRAADGTYHTIHDSALAFNIVYNFDIGLNSVPSDVVFTGYLADKHESVNVAAWNYTTSAWEIIGVINGVQTATNSVIPFTLFPDFVGKAAGLIGDVRIRFYSSALSDIIFNVDQIYVSYAVVERATGYSGHAMAATSTTIQLNSDAVAIDNYYVPSLLYVNHGTGAMQYAKVIGYTGATKTLLLELPMAVTLDTTSHISLSPWGSATTNNAAIASAVWSTPVSTLTDKTTVGGWISRVLLTIPKFLGLK